MPLAVNEAGGGRMLRQERISHSYRRVSPLQGLRRRRRSINVKVVEDGFLVDSFTVSDPRVLRSELRLIYRFLPRESGVVHLTGVEEEWLPLGIDRVQSETSLKNSADALFFLAA